MEHVLYGMIAIGISAIASDIYYLYQKIRYTSARQAFPMVASVVIIHALVFCCGAVFWALSG